MRGSRSTASFFITLLIIAASAISIGAQADAASGVLLFNGHNGTGASQPIPVGTFQVSGKQLGSGEVSVKVSKGYVATFCSAKDGTGKCEEFGEGTHNLASVDFNYIKVSHKTEAALAAPVIVYELEHWAGRSQGFAPGMYRSIKGEFGNILDNHAMSVIVAKGYRVKLCTEEGIELRGHGECEIYEAGRHELRFADDISFIEVKDLSDKSPDDEKMPVVLYEEASQVGKMQGFDVGVFSASIGDFKKLRKDQASSIWVKEGYRATVCKDEPVAAGGEPTDCEEFTAGKKNLKSRRTASYLKVSKASQ
jgi:hypothetical protein